MNLDVRYDAIAGAQDEEGSPLISVSLFERRSGMALSQLALQPRERVEIRVKVTNKSGKELEQCNLPDIVFTHEGSDPLTLPIRFNEGEDHHPIATDSQ